MNHIRNQLFQLEDEDYKNFIIKLTPGSENVLGVRLPKLRKLAVEISRGSWREYLAAAEDIYFEEIMLRGMVIGYAKADIDEIIGYISDFIPQINNWAVCDSFCSGLKIAKANQEIIWKFLQGCFDSKEPYSLRFGVVMLLNYYINDNYIDRVLQILDKINHPDYYVKMAAAWALSICFIKYPKKTLEYLKTSSMDNFTYNKGLQKIIESRQVDAETKSVIRSLKRK